MKVPVIAAASLTATTLLIVGEFLGGCGISAAQTDDYSVLLINASDVTAPGDVFTVAQPPRPNPNGQLGVETGFAHRDGTRQIGDTIVFLPDAPAAAAALEGSKATLGNGVIGGAPQPAAVGDGGTMISGASPDGSKAVTIVRFTEGNALTTLEFNGPANDPVPPEMVLEVAQKQDTAIKNGLSG
jgi:hypothetical protein